jgi:hypothetical protein
VNRAALQLFPKTGKFMMNRSRAGLLVVASTVAASLLHLEPDPRADELDQRADELDQYESHGEALAFGMHGGLARSAEEEPLDISDEDIETFADIYVQLERIARKYERHIASADSALEAQEIQARMQRESLDALERRGWTPERFDRFARALNSRPDLVEKALRLIERKS